jgi:hypothetical protein
MDRVPGRFAYPQDTRDKTRFAQFTRSILQVVAVILGLLVGYLQIKDIKPDVLFTPSTADIIWRLALVLYYWSWVGAINFEIYIQELAYVAFPGQGRWPVQLYIVLAVFVLIFATLLASYGNIAHFSVALTCFLLVDGASWLYLRRFFRSSIDDSRVYYSSERRFYELAILSMVERHMFGRWKWWRLMAGAAIVITADVLAFNRAFREATASAVQIICPWLSSSDATLLFYSMLFLLYVLLMEVWLWVRRIRLHVRLDTLEYLNGLYQLTPR